MRDRLQMGEDIANEIRESQDSEIPDHDKDVFGEMNTEEAEEVENQFNRRGGKQQANR